MVSLINRGEIWIADLGTNVGTEQNGIRPVVIIQNDIANKYAPTVIVAPLTSKINHRKLPTHVEVPAGQNNLNVDSVILLEQIRTIDKSRLKEKISTVNSDILKQIENAVEIATGKIQTNNLYAVQSSNNEGSVDIEKLYEDFYTVLKQQTESFNQLSTNIKHSNSPIGKLKDWILGGIIGYIICELLNMALLKKF